RDLVLVRQPCENQLVQIRTGDGRKGGRELLLQLDHLSLAVGLPGWIQGKFVEFTRNLQSLKVNAGNILRFELFAEEPVADLRRVIEDLAKDHEKDHECDNGKNESRLDTATGRRRDLRRRRA